MYIEILWGPQPLLREQQAHRPGLACHCHPAVLPGAVAAWLCGPRTALDQEDLTEGGFLCSPRSVMEGGSQRKEQT